MSRYNRLRRSLLYVPGDSRRKIEKAAASRADAVILDLEDGIAPDKRADAVATIADALQSLDYGAKERIVRLSGLDLAGELAAIAPAHPHGFLLPKVEHADEVIAADQALHIAEREGGMSAGLFALHAMTETALGVVNLREICQASPRLQTLVFGAEDYAASIGATRSREGSEILFARSAIVAHAAAFGLSAIDCVYVNYQDAEGFAAECALARQLGFAGKTIIHPAQIDPCNEHFLPTDAEIAWAQNVVRAFEQHQTHGAGAFNLNGVMVDRPLYLIALNLLSAAAQG